MEFKEFTGSALMRMLWIYGATTEFVPTTAFSTGDSASPPAAAAAVESSTTLVTTDELASRSNREGRFAHRQQRTESRPLRFNPAVIDAVLEDHDDTLRASRHARRSRAHRTPRTALRHIDVTE